MMGDPAVNKPPFTVSWRFTDSPSNMVALFIYVLSKGQLVSASKPAEPISAITRTAGATKNFWKASAGSAPTLEDQVLVPMQGEVCATGAGTVLQTDRSRSRCIEVSQKQDGSSEPNLPAIHLWKFQE